MNWVTQRLTTFIKNADGECSSSRKCIFLMWLLAPSLQCESSRFIYLVVFPVSLLRGTLLDFSLHFSLSWTQYPHCHLVPNSHKAFLFTFPVFCPSFLKQKPRWAKPLSSVSQRRGCRLAGCAWPPAFGSVWISLSQPASWFPFRGCFTSHQAHIRNLSRTSEFCVFK